MTDHREIESSDLPDGWLVENRAATWVVSTTHDTEFVYSYGTIRLTPGDAYGTSKHILYTDGVDGEETSQLPDRDTLIDRCGIICEVLDLAAADRLEASVRSAIENALTEGLKPRQSTQQQSDIGEQRRIGTFGG